MLRKYSLLLLTICFFGTEQVESLRSFQRSLRSFINNTQNRIKYSSAVYEANLKRALLAGKSIGATDVDRNGDGRLPYLTKGVENGPQQYRNKSFTEVDKRVLRFIAKQLGSNLTNNWVTTAAIKYQKLQDELPGSVPFPCSRRGGRSPHRPKSVDKLRAGDIDVIGAMGDSVMAGIGLVGGNILQFFIVNEGLTAVTGGYKDWRKVMTLANMLKEYNPNLVGYGSHDSFFMEGYDPKSFNVAVLASIVDDFPNMARTLVEKMKRDRRVNFQEDWKLVVYYGGNVDMCVDICTWENPEDAPAYHYKLMEQALDYLLENSPRTLIYFIITPNVPRFHSTLSKRGAFCEEMNRLECNCLYGEIYRKHKDKYIKLMEKITDAQIALVNHPKYQKKIDFAIVSDPMLTNTSYPKRRTMRGQEIDYRYLSVDCFHFSQRGHAGFATSLWNSLWTPIGLKKKYLNWRAYKDIECPTPEKPYIATPRNSFQPTKESKPKLTSR